MQLLRVKRIAPVFISGVASAVFGLSLYFFVQAYSGYTHRKEAFAVMQTGTVLVNVARGEIIDEEALLKALTAGKLRGVAHDVYVGEFEHEPDRRLWDDERVLITPHISAGTDKFQYRRVELFCENLHAYLNGRPLANVVDWERGY